MRLERAGTFPKQIIETIDVLKKERDPRLEVFEKIIKLVLPGLEEFLLYSRKNRPGGQEARGRWSGFGITQLQLFADGMFGYLVGPSIPWFQCKMAHQWQNEDPDIRKFCQDLTDHYRWRWNNTNFYDAMSTIFEHAGALGFSNVFTEEVKEDNSIIFHTYHPGELLFRENKYGIVDSVFREKAFKAGEAVDRFGKDNLPDSIVNAAIHSPSELYDFIHAVYPREDAKPDQIGPENMAFASVWVSIEEDKLVQNKGFPINPYFIWRFKKGTTAYGRGPAEDALAEITFENLIARDLLGVSQLAVRSSYNAPAELDGKVDVSPGGINFYADPTRKVTPVQNISQYPVGTDVMDRIKVIIAKHFKVEYFVLLSQREGVQPLNDLETMELMGEKAAVLGRPLSRFYRELIYPIFDRVWAIDFEAGRLPPIPDKLIEQGGYVHIEMMGPLAQAQKKMFQSQGYNASLEHLGKLAELFGPSVLDNIDSDRMTLGMMQMDGLDQDAIRRPEEIEMIREARAKAQAQIQAQEADAAGIDNIKSLAMADKAMGGQVAGLLTEGAGGGGAS